MVNLLNSFVLFISLKKVSLIIVLIIMGLCVIFGIVYGIVLHHNNNLRKTKYKDSLNKFLNCIVNLKNQTVRIIKLNDLNSQTTLPLLDFLKKFDIKQQNLIKLWLESLIINHDIQDNDKVFIANKIVETNNNKIKKTVRVTLNVNQIDRNNGLIYFVEEKQDFIPLEIQLRARLKRHNKFHKVFYSFDEIKQMYEEKTFRKGSIYFINLYSKKDVFCSFNNKYIFYKVVNEFFRKYDKSNIFVMFNEQNPLEILLIDTKSYTESQLSNKNKNLYKRVKAMAEVDGIARFFDIVSTSTKCIDLPIEFEKTFDLLNKYCLSLLDEGKYFQYLYAKSNDFKALQDSYSEEVSKVIRNNLINVNFNQVIKISPKRILICGFNYVPVIQDSSFKNFDEFQKYAHKFDLRKETFALVTRKAISYFNNQKESSSLRLFSLIDLEDVPYANRLFPHIPDLKDCNLVLTFKNNQFIDYEDDEYMHVIKNAQSKGYDCALYINLNDYSLKDSNYKLFDYFLFNFEGYKEAKANSREFIKVHSLLEKFVKFNKPIICVNVENWTIMELLIRSGITYFSSPNLLGNSTILSRQLDKKTIKKIQNMIKE